MGLSNIRVALEVIESLQEQDADLSSHMLEAVSVLQ